ncbi:MAG TPA: PBP1A family penicillin-binding protein [Holophagaceae bacterium]|nr:PBP1A family penicillin-binding protein [Holophagaceae bacterium]
MASMRFFSRPWVKRGLIALGALVLAGLATLGIAWYALSRDTDSFLTLFALRVPKTITKVLDRDGNVIGIFAEEHRVVIPYGDIPKAFTNGLVATEDADYWTHGGVSPRGFMRAGFTFVTTFGRRMEGASTLEMQLVRTVTAKRKVELKRKLKEIILARALDQHYTKQEILEKYANEVYFGGGRYGLEAAAEYYFGKSAPQLSVDECAMIVGLVKNPNGYNPYNGPRARALAQDRRNHVLRRMAAEGYLKPADADALSQKPLKLARESGHDNQIAAYAVEEVRKYLYDKYGSEAVLNGGLEVWTTLDANWQAAAEKAIQTGLRAVDRHRGFRKDALLYVNDPDKAKVAGWNTYFEPGDTVRGVVLGWSDGKDGGATVRIDEAKLEVPRAAFAWAGKDPKALMPRGSVPLFDVVEAKDGVPTKLALDQEPQIQGALLATDPKTGEIRALVGGYDFARSKYDRALQAQRQVGSTMKAFVYGAAFEKGGMTPATLVQDVPTRFLDSASFAVTTFADGRTDAIPIKPGAKPYEPKNYEHNFWGPITIWEALRDSRNVPAVRTLEQVGVQNVIDFAHRCGVQSTIPPYPSLALGSADISLSEMTQSYGTICNGGLQSPTPFLIKKVVDRQGRTLEEHSALATEQVLDPIATYQLIQCLQGVAQRGTGVASNALNWPVAGKTGTTEEHADAWFMGFSTRLVCGVWVGLDERKTIYRGADGAKVALPIWIDFMKAALPDTPKEDFKAPDGAEFVDVDRYTGLLATSATSPENLLHLAFKPGGAPTAPSDAAAIQKIQDARALAPTQPVENILWGRAPGVPPMPDPAPDAGMAGDDPNQ